MIREPRTPEAVAAAEAIVAARADHLVEHEHGVLRFECDRQRRVLAMRETMPHAIEAAMFRAPASARCPAVARDHAVRRPVAMTRIQHVVERLRSDLRQPATGTS